MYSKCEVSHWLRVSTAFFATTSEPFLLMARHWLLWLWPLQITTLSTIFFIAEQLWQLHACISDAVNPANTPLQSKAARHFSALFHKPSVSKSCVANLWSHAVVSPHKVLVENHYPDAQSIRSWDKSVSCDQLLSPPCTYQPAPLYQLRAAEANMTTVK